ncbi:MAG TPA: NUDIX domain-containing protein [Gemmatimonadaceae bacterium]|nr:NUDIX domain-containing protein [Gemmatimonadaceae bacterium]
MTDLVVGVVDVFVVRHNARGLSVLVLRRAAGTRCTGAWEIVHGRLDPGERPEEAAMREVREETGFAIERLYNLTCQPFYLHTLSTVQVAVAFVAFVGEGEVALSLEHDTAEWLTPDEAMARLSWPRSISALRDVVQVFHTGSAGAVEDVLRVF